MISESFLDDDDDDDDEVDLDLASFLSTLSETTGRCRSRLVSALFEEIAFLEDLAVATTDRLFDSNLVTPRLKNFV